MERAVVDTNVAVVANGGNTHADAECKLKCQDRLVSLVEHGVILIDDQDVILSEYRKNLKYSGQPGVGDAFFKFLHDNQAINKRVRKIKLTPNPKVTGDYTEFQPLAKIAGFDPDDVKFAAVALAGKVPVWNATDSDWAKHYAELRRLGLRVCQLCPQHATKADNSSGGAVSSISKRSSEQP